MVLRKLVNHIVYEDTEFKKQHAWVLDTVGSNLLDILSLDFIDNTRTFSNDIQEVRRVLGIEAARHIIYQELTEVFDNGYINSHHLGLLCDRMCATSKMISIFRHGINSDNIGPIAKASFEETPEMFLKAAKHGELDLMTGVSANIMCGQEGFYGTSSFQVLFDFKDYVVNPIKTLDDTSNDLLSNLNPVSDGGDCSLDSLTMNNNTSHLQTEDLGNDDDYTLDI